VKMLTHAHLHQRQKFGKVVGVFLAQKHPSDTKRWMLDPCLMQFWQVYECPRVISTSNAQASMRLTHMAFLRVSWVYILSTDHPSNTSVGEELSLRTL